MEIIIGQSIAEVAELADALGSGPSGVKSVGVRVPSSALLLQSKEVQNGRI